MPQIWSSAVQGHCPAAAGRWLQGGADLKPINAMSNNQIVRTRLPGYGILHAWITLDTMGRGVG